MKNNILINVISKTDDNKNSSNFNQLRYLCNNAIVTDQGQKQTYLLHPVAADRFCLGISLLEYIAPDLYKNYDKLMSKDFNPWKPKSLDFWRKHVDYINGVQSELLKRATKIENRKLAELYKQVYHFISLDPMKRNFILSETTMKSALAT